MNSLERTQKDWETPPEEDEDYIKELEQKIEILKDNENKLNAKIYMLENEIAELAKGQSSEVVRDIEYQIGRMEDAIDYYLADTSDMDAGQRFLNEWSECKKIMRSK